MILKNSLFSSRDVATWKLSCYIDFWSFWLKNQDLILKKISRKPNKMAYSVKLSIQSESDRKERKNVKKNNIQKIHTTYLKYIFGVCA